MSFRLWHLHLPSPRQRSLLPTSVPLLNPQTLRQSVMLVQIDWTERKKGSGPEIKFEKESFQVT